MAGDTPSNEKVQTTVYLRREQRAWISQHDVLTLSSIVRKQIDTLMDSETEVVTVDADEFEFSHTRVGDES